MPKSSDQKFASEQHLKRSFNQITLLGIGFLALAIIFTTLAYRAQTSTNTPARIISHENMAFEIEAELTLYQLSLQTIVIGEQTLQPERIDAHLQRALHVTKLMLEGGEYRRQIVEKNGNPSLTQQLEETKRDIIILKTLGDQWMGLTHGLSSNQDIKFDTLFDTILIHIAQVQGRLASEVTQQLSVYQRTAYQLYGAILFCSLVLLVIFYASNRRYYKTSQRLMVSEEKSRLLLDASVDVSVIFNENLLVQSFNKTAEKTFGYSEAEIKGQPFHHLLAEPFASNYLSDMQKYLSEGETEIVGHFRQLVARHKDHSSLPMDTMINTVIVDGQTLFVATARDISARLKQEQENRDIEARTQAIVDSAVDGIITIDGRGLVKTYNPAAEKIFGYSDSEVIGKNVNMLMPPSRAVEHDSYINNFITTGTAKIIGLDREVVGQRKNGSSFPMDLSVAEAKIAGQHIFTGIVRDISQRKLVEDQLLQAKEEAERANHAKSDFLSRMSHELRTPLNAILGFSQLLEMDNLNPVQNESVQHIIKAGRHLTGLINEVLDIARIESGRQDLSLEPLKICTLLDDTRQLMEPLAAERNIKLQKLDPGQCDTHVAADLQRLKQVLLNLISNALKYNHDGGQVTLFCEETREGILRVNIRDTGPGIAPDNLRRVFEPFERLDADAQGVEGSGVGLALSKALVEAMGGVLGLDSQVGTGSTFWIELAIIDPPSASDTAQHCQQKTLAQPDLDKKQAATVLYIEDNIANFRLVEVALSRRPHIQLITAMEGELGLELALRHQPDLILLDIHLPVLMGDKVLARLRAQPETQHIPVVVISADATQSKVDKLLAAGAHTYLTKPFNIKELLRTVDSLLETRTHQHD